MIIIEQKEKTFKVSIEGMKNRYYSDIDIVGDRFHLYNKNKDLALDLPYAKCIIFYK
jgi:hypothetical protein